MALRVRLRTKLALVSLVLLIVPWTGYRYIVEMERFLLEGQQQALLATAKAIATTLHEKPALMRLTTPLRAPRQETDAATDGSAPVETAIPVPADMGQSADRDASREDESLAELLRGAERSNVRLWIANREFKILAVAGSLKPAEADGEPGRWQRLLAWLIHPPARDFDDAFDEDMLAAGPEVTGALLGAGGTRVRNTRDDRAVVVSAAHPIWAADNVVGVVVAEETTNPILSVKNEALGRLVILTLAALGAVGLFLLGFASRLSARIRRLRDEAESAVDARGRIASLATASTAGDEIGDLSRSFSTILGRLAQHHAYLESLASRLSHELRTPVAVVQSSLDNLRMEGVSPQAAVYVERAGDGLTRLSRILSRMSEASRLEASLVARERERYDLSTVVGNCTEGYRLAYPAQDFVLEVPGFPVMVNGSPDLAAQLLDKLAANAADFSSPGRPIRVALSAAAGRAVLAVANNGPCLAEGTAGKLFDSMVSIRPGGGEEPHLGLGLYVARLIAEFHGGSIAAENLPGRDGVAVVVTLPTAP
ncbi:MAG TPA: ATP-binding protein [Rhodocyclaceae bacterium]